MTCTLTPGRRRGFTVVEMLAVIGIIALLAAIGLVVISSVQSRARKTRLRMDLSAIATALEAYKTDHGDYPRPAIGATTASGDILAWALIAPGPAGVDGQDGPGFRTAPGVGRVWGPYIGADKFPLQGGGSSYDILDNEGGRIVYVAANPRFVPGRPLIGTAAGCYINLDPTGLPYGYPADELRRLLGDDNNNNTIDAGETQKYSGPFILISLGQDRAFGGGDDVTNFEP